MFIPRPDSAHRPAPFKRGMRMQQRKLSRKISVFSLYTDIAKGRFRPRKRTKLLAAIRLPLFS
ncbi:MAG: hypothetical protein LBS59_03325 [Puniceicoccales bacterium]|nr:hypothetical protein [Puniceicoccales bacterium]